MVYKLLLKFKSNNLSMEGKKSNDSKSKISLPNKGENKTDHMNQVNGRNFFNSVTGELMTEEDGNEEDMYEIVPDMEQYAQDNIMQYTDIHDKDKQFCILWNSFIQSKGNPFTKLEDLLIEFLNINSKYLYEKDLKKNFAQHLNAVLENRQIDDEGLRKIIRIMYNLFKQYEK